ncbi:MAG: hypothetical protein ACJA2Q_001701 [Pseudohongiellaceae bacterium]|jgi:hypothetical protein
MGIKRLNSNKSLYSDCIKSKGGAIKTEAFVFCSTLAFMFAKGYFLLNLYCYRQKVSCLAGELIEKPHGDFER